jgi:predicted branched-subunit amino acid permease
VGATVPDVLALDAALPLCLLAIVAPSLRERGPRAVAVSAAVATVVLAGLPYGLGVACAATLAIAVGVGTGTRSR